MGASRRLREPLFAAVAVALVAVGALLTGAAESARRPVADALVQVATLRPPPSPAGAPAGAPDVALVALDPPSLRAYPDWPWPRGRYAVLIERLESAGAKAIAFDIDFSTPRDPAGDLAFARAMEASGRVVLATFRQVQPLEAGELEIASVPIPALREAAAALGSVVMPLDPDGLMRRAPRREPIAGIARPSLAESALDVATGRPAAAGLPDPFVRIDYRRALPPVPQLSAADVLESRFDPRDVAGRVVLVGATAVEFQDTWATPVGLARPGVWVQALLLRTLTAERSGASVLHRPPLGAELGVALLVSLAAAVASTAGARQRLVGLAGLAVAFPALSAALVTTSGLLLDPAIPLGVVSLHYALGLETVRRRFRRDLAESEHSLATLYEVGETTAGPGSWNALETALALLADVVDASAVVLFRADEEGALGDERLEWCRRGEGPLGDAEAARAALAERRLRVYPSNRPGPSPRPGLAVYLPLWAGDTAVGVLAVERDRRAPLAEAELRTIATVGSQVALSAENLRLIAQLRATFDASIEAMATAIEARDGYTESHCRRLALFSSLMASRLNLPPEEVEAIRLGALLHDVGKIGIRDEVLLKPGRFTPEERRAMQGHAELGHRIVSPIHGIHATTIACVRHHHERWDGHGYPDGLAGDAIPLGARLVSIVDVWDALSTARPYKPPYPQDTVRRILEKGRGVEFDPAIVDLFFSVLDEEGDAMLAMLGEPPEDES
jgi:HD-GYP domain-containing protein (c-di-GMP phosphodiesterase class II)/CHASE2 domain-containing sensor protein